jgi:6-phosphogluconolactonase
MSQTASPTICVFPTPEALAAAATDHFVAAAETAIRATGRFAVALSGGSTPRALYARLAEARHGSRVEWSRVQVFWGDERCVAPDDADSNALMARAALLDHVPIPPANVHRMRGEESPRAAAAQYEQELRATFGTPSGPPRAMPLARLDLVLLGLGPDGHTASLFPALHAVDEIARWVMAEYIPSVSMWRITLTPVVINAAAEVLFLVTGTEKASIVQRVLEGPHDPHALPAQVVAPGNGILRWFVDADAAAGLRTVRAR